jgi:hypothetical protein
VREHGARYAGGVRRFAREDIGIHRRCVRLLACEVTLCHQGVFGPSESISEVVEDRVIVEVDVTNVDDRRVIVRVVDVRDDLCEQL